MFLHVVEARYVHDFTIWVKFDDGSEGEVDLQFELEGEVFGPLKDIKRFRAFRVDPEIRTVVWSNGADFAPEFLHKNLRITT